MVYIQVRHRIVDYTKWREGYDEHAPAREAAGATGDEYVLRNVEDPREITVLLGWSDLEKARSFTQSSSLKEAMQNAGVQGQPKIQFLETAA